MLKLFLDPGNFTIGVTKSQILSLQPLRTNLSEQLWTKALIEPKILCASSARINSRVECDVNTIL
ncbi:hypothetical protein PN483_21170 [Nodularia spumigena CS-591/04]|nr:hypothetical protein [Nodularia spumigena CS-591/07A]MDB9332964.1 hypothetical protein [Nodularia spumigena CS-591/04]MDB9363904.1 hypothetical protein [Nodularia spumigena CS-588/02A10]